MDDVRERMLEKFARRYAPEPESALAVMRNWRANMAKASPEMKAYVEAMSPSDIADFSGIRLK